MNIEQIKEELLILEGNLLQLATDETDGTYGAIKKYIKDLMDKFFDNDDDVLYTLCTEALDTLEWSIIDVKPFE